FILHETASTKTAGIARDRRHRRHRKLKTAASAIAAMTCDPGDLGDSNQSISSIEHDPGPSGLPHVPQGPAELAANDSPDLPWTAKRESCWSSFLLSHLGHFAAFDPITMASKWWSHSRQIYSKIGIDNLLG